MIDGANFACKISKHFLFQSAFFNLILIHLSEFSYSYLDRSRTPAPNLGLILRCI